MFGLGPASQELLCDAVRKYYILFCGLGPLQLFIHAPFGRFAPSTPSIFLVDGIKAWIAMEICSPLFFLYVLYSTSWGAGMGTQQRILTAAFFVHYSNRALISPLRTPSRSKAHIMVPLCVGAINAAHSWLLAIFLSSSTPSPPIYFSVGLTLWAVGFVGNVAHDEILVNIRRNLKDKRDEDKGKGKEGKGEHYAIPHGLLFSFVSFPNYLCEWIEWFGFSLATDPRLVQSFSLSSISLSSFSLASLSAYMRAPAADFLPIITAPWLFMIADLLIMTPRAYRGHLWYRARFGDAYPKDRKIIVPFLL
ncbi:hypothetical protein DFH09DRAFT_1246912 [Mycena vulgaris]|nr:hypothetical protein DFH09DRAFT_1246912 [Mycena vulgaris]